MPPRNELPEGTDHIINGAMEAGGGEDFGADALTETETGSGTGAAASGGGSSSGFIGAGAGAGTSSAGTSSAGTSSGGGTTVAKGSDSKGSTALEPVADVGGGSRESRGATEQLKSQAYALRDQAGEKVRGFADTGKTRATDLLEELSRVVADTADSIDERLGANYGEYARKASDSVSGLAGTLRGKDVDELYGNVRDAVRKSPGIAIGVAAVVGFTLARLVKAGLDDRGHDRSGSSRGNDGPGA